MKLSLSGRLVESAGGTVVPPVEFLDLAARCGYDAVDLRASQLAPATGEADLAAIRAKLTETRLAVFETAYAGPLADDADDAAFSRFVERVAPLGAEGVRLGGDLATLKRAARLARPFGACVLYQMHTGGPFETIRSAAAAIAEINEPNFRVLPEPANCLLAGEEFGDDMFAPLAGRIGGVHVQTVEVHPDGADALTLADGREVRYDRVPYDRNGQIDFATFFAALRRAGFDGTVNELEPCGQLDDLAPTAARAAAFLRPLLT